MSIWTTKIGDQRLNRYARNHELARAQADQLATILKELHVDDAVRNTAPTYATAGGDERRLRGIPVVGARGVGGAIPGSRPGDGLR